MPSFPFIALPSRPGQKKPALATDPERDLKSESATPKLTEEGKGSRQPATGPQVIGVGRREGASLFLPPNLYKGASSKPCQTARRLHSPKPNAGLLGFDALISGKPPPAGRVCNV